MYDICGLLQNIYKSCPRKFFPKYSIFIYITYFCTTFLFNNINTILFAIFFFFVFVGYFFYITLGTSPNLHIISLVLFFFGYTFIYIYIFSCQHVLVLYLPLKKKTNVFQNLNKYFFSFDLL